MAISNLTKKRIFEYLEKGKRFDNRGLLNHREISIETNVTKNAEGSARVKLGKTEVLVGVKMDIGEPYTDSPDEGVLITTAELTPLSSDRFEYGPPRIEAIELSRIVDRGVRESGFIDFKKLCVKKREKVWILFLDIYSINDDGNLLDAACLAAVAALKTAKIPKYDEKEEKVEYGEFTNKKVPLIEKNFPITITCNKINENIFLDPSFSEEEVSQARISFTITQSSGKEPRINAIQKGNDKEINKEQFEKMVDVAIDKAKEMNTKVLKLIEKK